jgi:hypothetical protein
VRVEASGWRRSKTEGAGQSEAHQHHEDIAMRQAIIALTLLLAPIAQARADVSVNLELPGIDIGVNVPVFPRLVQVPGYPVYFDPNGSSNYFFYDGLYWVYQGDDWYESTWFNGPWRRVDRDDVPAFLLRVPVRYYRRPPEYFHGWRGDAPPRWAEHWGHDWEQHHGGWDRWDRRAPHAAAPLPAYQRAWSGERYPTRERQQAIRTENYHYMPREAVGRSRFEQERSDVRTRREAPPPGHVEAPAPGHGERHEMDHRGKEEERGRN